MKVILTAIVGVLIVCAHAESAIAADKIVLNTGIKDPFTTKSKSGFIDLIVKEAFHRIDLVGEVIVYQNSTKSLKNANIGIDDGVALRIKGLEKKFPNLIRVPEKIMDNDFVAYSPSTSIRTDSWASLNDFRVSYVDGWQIFQNNLKDHPSLKSAKNAQQMFDMLSAKDVDLMLYERWQGLWRAEQLGISLQVSEPPLAKREMFLYLNKIHANLVDKVSGALAAMKKDGTYKKIFDETLGKLR